MSHVFSRRAQRGDGVVAERARATVALSLATLLAAALSAGAVRAADIFVLDAVLERDGGGSAAPTFLVTPGERALLRFQDDTDIEVAMTLESATADGFSLRAELIDGVDVQTTTVGLSLAETVTFELAGRAFKVLVRRQTGLETSEPASADGAAND